MDELNITREQKIEALKLGYAALEIDTDSMEAEHGPINDWDMRSINNELDEMHDNEILWTFICERVPVMKQVGESGF